MFQKMMVVAKGRMVQVAASGVAVLGSATAALAEPTFSITPPEFDIVGLGTYASTILTALAAVWLIRKYIKTTNRS